MNLRFTTRTVATIALTALASASFGMSMIAGGGGYDLSWHTIDGGGGISTGSNFSLHGTIGQHDAGVTLAGGAFALNGGFWAGGAPPASNPVATLTAYTMVKGTRLNGGLPELVASDDQYFHTRSGFGQTFTDLHHMEVRIDARSDVSNPTLLDLVVESRINHPSGIVQLRMYNWTTSTWVQVRSHSINQNEAVITVNDLDATRYVNASGEIRLSKKDIVFVPQFAFTFQSYIDQVQFSVE